MLPQWGGLLEDSGPQQRAPAPSLLAASPPGLRLGGPYRRALGTLPVRWPPVPAGPGVPTGERSWGCPTSCPGWRRLSRSFAATPKITCPPKPKPLAPAAASNLGDAGQAGASSCHHGACPAGNVPPQPPRCCHLRHSNPEGVTWPPPRSGHRSSEQAGLAGGEGTPLPRWVTRDPLRPEPPDPRCLRSSPQGTVWWGRGWLPGQKPPPLPGNKGEAGRAKDCVFFPRQRDILAAGTRRAGPEPLGLATRHKATQYGGTGMEWLRSRGIWFLISCP